jgi:hypothetical protein
VDVDRVYFRTDGSMIVIHGTTGYVLRNDAVIAHQELAADGLTVLGYTA